MPHSKGSSMARNTWFSINFQYSTDAKPWAPFQKRINGRWASDTRLSFINYSDVQRSLEAARHFGVRFQSSEVSHTFKGKVHVFKFQYRDPWKWLLDIVTDPTLNNSIMWYPVEKYLHQNGCITRIYDKLNTGTHWWKIQDSLPQEVGVPHCFLPLHLWLDKSNVAKTVKKHPIILCPGFLHSVIRNASGNGGGVLIGYMNIVGDPSETVENEDDSASSVEIAKFRREGVKANYPCPRCLIHKSLLHNLSIPLVMQTQQDMKQIFTKAQKLKSSAAEKVLRDAGLYLVENAFWSIQNSDPYLAYSYDMLHAFDSGEWDHILDEPENKQLSANFREVPRWCFLKHFNAVTSIDFADGNSYQDILKCIIPCLTDILLSNSPVIHCFRLLGILRTIAGLCPVSKEHIKYFEECLPKYEELCTRLSNEYNKNYNYPKHHFLMHLPWDLRTKASTDNYTTRAGEGFQQEVQQAYDQTNFRNTEPQIVRIDENQEAIA
ncbi:hypothetical protein M422DRAFT_256913 [Sphaerobolus stellatus SS14]|uniref:Unplaced genomic scaffold SPHSTscaffold_70, whole genome shotgun sequence n=1 Tax=Sphaerobolus stellatus (strain SS14) TaxID=990650 RepID=A0A0C9UB34_SPHS4|nr:hypothetical protein M422DRAFT_256913 [Sphaerobolus stellatus SS14]